MKTVALDDDTRYKLGFLSNGNETLGDTVQRLVDAEIKKQQIKIPAT